MIKVSTQSFIDKSNKVHNFKYDYSLSIYSDSRIKIEIICPIHESFFQTPNAHLNGRGCPKCFGNSPLSDAEILKRFHDKHGDTYDYSKAKFSGNHYKIIIICKLHGEFEQAPQQHFIQGCAACAGVKKMNTDVFIKKAAVAHKFYYDYSATEYLGRYQKIVIICPKHGEFLQNPYGHLRGHGCTKCSTSISHKETIWLDSLNVPLENRNKIFTLGGRKFNVDGYYGDNKIVYEFLGDYWHGNPNVYCATDLNLSCKRTFGELFNEIEIKLSMLREHGFKIISIWESEFDEKVKNVSNCRITI